ncbi:MAG: hypothetical protein WA581_08855 [Candidatus Acidiferrales bacterium]
MAAARETSGFQMLTKLEPTGTVLFTTSYVVAIAFSSEEGQYRNTVENADPWRRVTFGRVLAVIMFSVVASATIYLHWRDERRKARASLT